MISVQYHVFYVRGESSMALLVAVVVIVAVVVVVVIVIIMVGVQQAF